MKRTVLALAMLGGLAACHGGPPKGQVVATVDGEAITRRDLVAELTAANLPKGADVAALQPIAAADLVNRQLLVDQAKRQGFDKNPDYLATVERARQLALAQMLVSSWTAKQPAPGEGEIAAFIAANPQMFADRKLLVLDQIQTGSAGLATSALEPLQSMDAMVTYLRAHGRTFQRGGASLDTMTAPPAAIRQIEGLAPGVPFITARGGTLFISAVQEVKPAPVPEAQRTALAAQAIRQQASSKLIADHLKSLHAGAKIEYQPGFAPPAPSHS